MLPCLEINQKSFTVFGKLQRKPPNENRKCAQRAFGSACLTGHSYPSVIGTSGTLCLSPTCIFWPRYAREGSKTWMSQSWKGSRKNNSSLFFTGISKSQGKIDTVKLLYWLSESKIELLHWIGLGSFKAWKQVVITRKKHNWKLWGLSKRISRATSHSEDT